MRNAVPSPLLLVRSVTDPRSVLERFARGEYSALGVFFGSAIWLLILPPLFAYFGAARFGWSIGGVDPLFLSSRDLLAISLAYFAVLVVGLLSTAAVSQWMAATYGAQQSFGAHIALITVVAIPLALGSVVHLYPHLVVNLLVLVPMLIWSLYLLYWGLPIALGTNRERGMLMASSLVGYLLVAAVSLLGVTVVLWTYGIGPRIWI